MAEGGALASGKIAWYPMPAVATAPWKPQLLCSTSGAVEHTTWDNRTEALHEMSCGKELNLAQKEGWNLLLAPNR